MNDSLCKCNHCSSDACYEHKQQAITVWSCMGCGYTSNELMINESELVKQTEEILPELYKDLKFIDDKNQVWYPTFVNVEDKGTVFVNGTNVDNWGWAGIKSVKTTDEEKIKLKGAIYKSDPKTLKTFNKDEFDEALHYVGLV